MPLLNAEWAYARYQAVRHRLPSADTPRSSQYAESLLDIAEHFDAVVYDAYGVLNVGDTAIAGAPQRVAELQAMGKHQLVLTNGASHGKFAALEKYHRFGYGFDEQQVVSSRDALSLALSQKDFVTRRWGAAALPNSELEQLGVQCSLLEDDPRLYHSVEGFILLSSQNWSEQRNQRLIDALKAQPRPVLVGNPDIVAPREDAFSLEPGYYAHEAADATGVAPLFYGKPFGNAFDLVKEKLAGTAPERVLMVGDTLHTDIIGGAAAGFRTALVSDHGLFKGYNADKFIKDSGITPDFIVPSI